MPLEKETKPAAASPARQAQSPSFFGPSAAQPQSEPFLKRAVQPETEGETQFAEPQSEEAASEIDPTSAIRQEVFKLFEVLKTQGVLAKPGSPLGSEDADWKDITGYTQEDWNKRKALEAPWDAWREYNNQVKSREIWEKAEEIAKDKKKKNPLPFVPIPKRVEKPEGDVITKLTTCILVQTKILARASKNLKLNYDTAHLMDPKMMKESPAWNWASPHMGERPAPGDIFILISLGEKLKKAKDSLSRAQNQSPKELQRLKDTHANAEQVLKTWKDKAFEESEKAYYLDTVIQVIEKDQQKNKQLLKQSKELLKQQNGMVKMWKKNTEAARKALEDALNAKQRAQNMLEDARTGEQFRTQLFFSHVGFFVSKEPMPGDPTKELWKTFDGGQTFTEGKTTKQGAKYVDRVYDPTTNEIWAKPHQAGQIESQDGQTRWFLGWYNLDKLVKPKEEKKPAHK